MTCVIRHFTYKAFNIRTRGMQRILDTCSVYFFSPGKFLSTPRFLLLLPGRFAGGKRWCTRYPEALRVDATPWALKVGAIAHPINSPLHAPDKSLFLVERMTTTTFI